MTDFTPIDIPAFGRARSDVLDSNFTAAATAIASKMNNDSQNFTGTPTAPTAAAGTNTTQLATTAHVFAERSNAATLTNKNILSPTGITKADVGLGNADNTSDANKPISTAQQTALDLKAPIASPTFTGIPAAPTATAGTGTTQIATTAFVMAAAFSSALPSQTGNAGKFVTTDGTNASWTVLNVNPQWAIKTTTYTAVASDAIQANTTSGAWTLTLPATPTANDVVRISDYAGTFATNNLTVGRNGSNIMGLAEDMTVSTNNVSLTLTFIDVTRGWALT